MVAVLAHALAVIGQRLYGREIDAGQVAVAALYHDASEILTGDMPTPIKYYNPEIKNSYRKVEAVANDKLLSLLPEEIRTAARAYDPSRINRYVIELAARFHKFYTVCRLRGEEDALLRARLKLVDCTRQVLAVGLGILGVSAPEKM